MKIRPVGAELFHADRQTDGRIDITKLIDAFLQFGEGAWNLQTLGIETDAKVTLKWILNK